MVESFNTMKSSMFGSTMSQVSRAKGGAARFTISLSECSLSYQTMTQMQNMQSTMIEGYLEALKYFDENDFLKAIGFDSRGVDTIIIFGNRFKDVQAKDKNQFPRMMQNFFSVIDLRSRKWQIIYFHTKVGFSIDPILQILTNLKQCTKLQADPNLTDIVTIDMTKMDRMRAGGDFKKFASERSLKITNFDNIIEYFRTQTEDARFCLKLVNVMPKDITTVYYQERQKQNFTLEVANPALLAMGLGLPGQNSDPKPEPVKNFNPDEKTHEVQGKYLEQLHLIRIQMPVLNGDIYELQLPQVFFLLTQYFLDEPSLLEHVGVFRVGGEDQFINELDLHLSFGDFSKMQKVPNRPHEVANLLKQYIRELGEPVCPYNLYEQFRDLDKNMPFDQRLDLLATLLHKMPVLNKDLIMYLAWFFREVSTHSSANKMPIDNLAVVISPNIWKAQSLSPFDLQRQGTLVENFLKMMQNFDPILERIDNLANGRPVSYVPGNDQSEKHESGKLEPSVEFMESDEDDFNFDKQMAQVESTQRERLNSKLGGGGSSGQDLMKSNQSVRSNRESQRLSKMEQGPLSFDDLLE